MMKLNGFDGAPPPSGRGQRKPSGATGAPPKKLSAESRCGGGKCCRKTIACLLAARMSGDGPGVAAAESLRDAATGAVADDNRGKRKNFHRTQATRALNAIISDMTVHLRTNASGPLSAPCDDTPTANATTSSTPQNVTAALISASSFARSIGEPLNRRRAGRHGETLNRSQADRNAGLPTPSRL